MTQLNREQLDDMNIWQLRDYARKLGHNSPASQRKAQLIEFVLQKYKDIGDAHSDNAEQSVSQDKPKRGRGRPPKKVVEYTIPTEDTAVLAVAENVPKQESQQVTEQVAAETAPIAPKEEEKPKDNNTRVQFNKFNGRQQTRDMAKENVGDWRTFNNQRDRNDRNDKGDRNQFYKPYDRNNGNDRNNNGDRNNNQFDRNNNGNYQANNGNSNYASQDQEQNQSFGEEVGIREGVLEICPDGYGFLRAKNYEQGDGDAYVAVTKIRRSGLRKGDYVVANVKKLAENRPWNVQEIISVNGMPPEKAFSRPTFDSLTPIYPDSRIRLEIDGAKNDIAIRSIDLVAPIGKGQRAMIVSPPKAGKTTLLKKIAHSISTNYPDAHLMVLLVDERPEEVTDMQRSIQGEVIFSTFDEMPEHHTKAAEMVLERAKRLVECGKDVIILMDSLTRLARAYNLVITPTGKTLSGGIDPGALHNPKRFFGAARNIEFGGSLTIIATALVDTGSRMDDVIYEEFKGTGNMEIHLDRRLSEKRIFPAIDLNKSGTRREELLLSSKELEGAYAMRKLLSAGDAQEAAENLIGMMVRTKDNKEFIDQLSLQVIKLQKEGYKVF